MPIILQGKCGYWEVILLAATPVRSEYFTEECNVVDVQQNSEVHDWT
jgi:hypothetical protein